MAWSNDDSITVVVGGGTQAIIRLHSNPSGASVVVEGQSIGVTPIAIQGEPGTYHIVMSLAGYNDCVKDVTVVAGQDVTVTCDLTQIAPTTGVFNITSSPSGAEVYIDGNYEGVTYVSVELQPATYQIVLKKEGYQDLTDNQTLTAGQTVPLNYTLTPVEVQKAGMGWLFGLGLAGAAMYEMTRKKGKRRTK